MGLIKISIVYGVHSYRALKYAGKPWIRQSIFRQCFKSTISTNFFTTKVFYYTVVYSIFTTMIGFVTWPPFSHHHY